MSQVTARIHDTILLDPPLMGDGVALSVVRCASILSEKEHLVVQDPATKSGHEKRFILVYDEEGLPQKLIPFSQSILRVRLVA